MTMRQFYDWQSAGGASDVTTLVQALEAREIPWCMIGGLAVNHWADEPMATADVDLARLPLLKIFPSFFEGFREVG